MGNIHEKFPQLFLPGKVVKVFLKLWRALLLAFFVSAGFIDKFDGVACDVTCSSFEIKADFLPNHQQAANGDAS